MLNITAKNISAGATWSLQFALSVCEKFNGTILFTSPETENENKIIVGVHPICNISEKQNVELKDIDEIIKTNNEIQTPLLFGYISYDAKHLFEEKNIYKNLKDTGFPEFEFKIYQFVFVFDQNWDLINAVEYFIDIITYNRIKINDLYEVHQEKNDLFNVEFVRSIPTKEQFINGVHKIKEYIKEGDVYQVNLTRKIEYRFTGSIISIARELLTSNRIEFGVFHKSNDKYIISTSPERFVKYDNNKILASPIKGTLERTTDDEAQTRKLLSDTKNLRELAMITDLLRNDISIICKPGTVNVLGYPILKTLTNVHHLVSDIEGELCEKDFSKIMKGVFPGGSITGCPKIRACQIIEELENNGRGPYTGSFGYLTGNHSCDLNILIRTVLIENNTLSFNVGGGITLLSDPDDEYLETQHKAANIINALNI